MLIEAPQNVAATPVQDPTVREGPPRRSRRGERQLGDSLAPGSMDDQALAAAFAVATNGRCARRTPDGRRSCSGSH